MVDQKSHCKLVHKKLRKVTYSKVKILSALVPVFLEQAQSILIMRSTKAKTHDLNPQTSDRIKKEKSQWQIDLDLLPYMQVFHKY